MADLTITATQVLHVSGPTETGVAYVAITAGQVVYERTADHKWALAQADGTAEEAGVGTRLALALNSPAAGQPVVVALPGARVNLGAGAAAAASEIRVVSATAGGLAAVADIVTAGHRRSVATLGAGTNMVDVIGKAPGAAVP